jgi:hypothetical protein
MILFFLIIGSIITIIASFFAFLEKSKENKLQKKRNIYNTLIFIFIIIGVIISFFTGFDSLIQKNSSDSIANAKQNQIINLTNQNKEEIQKARETINSKQNQIISLQEKHSIEITDKTNKIINLQDRIINKIPDAFFVNFESIVNFSDTEINQINDIFLKSNKSGNAMPFNTTITNEGFEKINSFKNLQLEFDIRFYSNNGKFMLIKIKKGPLALLDYNSKSFDDVFLLSLRDKTVYLEGYSLYTNNIESPSLSPSSLLDFENSKVIIEYTFFYPDNNTGYYLASKPDYLLLDLKKISLTWKNYNMHISNLKKVDKNRFEGNWIVNK